MLKNEGSEISSPDMPILGTTETITTESQSRFMTSFDIDYSLTETIQISAIMVNSETTMSETFIYHNEEEMTETQTVSSTLTVTWPSECKPGFQLTYLVLEAEEKQELPVELLFERGGERWTEVQVMDVTLRRLEVSKDDCCIFDYASDLCGSEQLPMCD